MAESTEVSDQSQNELKVKKMLLDIPGLAVKELASDLFLVSEPETGVEFTADVEDNVLFLRSEIEEIGNNGSEELYRFLLETNANTVHVAFAIDENSLILKGNLEIQNLDENELEASCKSIVVTLFQVSDELEKLLGK